MRLLSVAAVVAAAEAALAAVLVASALSTGDDPEPRDASVIGQTPLGTEITAEQLGDPAAERVILVVGVIHGDEPAGVNVIDELREDGAPEGTQLWLVRALNPDGLARNDRRNPNGVDLNRNFPYRWKRGTPKSSGYYPGPAPASEPETRAAMELIERIRPDVSVWYHQPWGAVLACKGKPRLAARYAKLVKMRGSCRGNDLRGTAISWTSAEVGGTAFVVEFPKGSVSQQTARRHARAVAIIGGDE